MTGKISKDEQFNMSKLNKKELSKMKMIDFWAAVRYIYNVPMVVV